MTVRGWQLWLLVLAAALCVSGLSRSAVAARELSAYEVQIDLRNPARARYELRFEYSGLESSAVGQSSLEDIVPGLPDAGLSLPTTPSPLQRETGFKFLGDEPIFGLRAHTASGEPVRVHDAAGYRETRIEYDLPPPTADGTSTLIISFAQELAGNYGWSGILYRVPWAHKFKIPVHEMTVHVIVPAEGSVPRYQCQPFQGARRCSRSERSAFPVELTVARGAGLGPVGVGAGGLLLLAAMLLLHWRGRERARRERGILPPQTEVAYAPPPPPPGDAYRAPPPIPAQAPSPQPRIAPEDASSLRNRLLLLVLANAAGLAFLAIVANERSPIPMPLLMGIALAVGLVASFVYLGAVEGRSWAVVGNVFACVGLAVLASPLGALAALAAPLWVFVLSPILAAMPSGGGSSSGYSGSTFSCSSSSCGSSCGGGGSCGGCGG